jgi:hypothetical protein
MGSFLIGGSLLIGGSFLIEGDFAIDVVVVNGAIVVVTNFLKVIVV